MSGKHTDAAEIAGLKVLSLIENTAAALQHGLDRIFKDEKSHKMLVYNMGAASTQVSIFGLATTRERRVAKT